MALKTHNEVTLFYRHFETSETYRTAFQYQLEEELTHAQKFLSDAHSKVSRVIFL